MKRTAITLLAFTMFSMSTTAGMGAEPENTIRDGLAPYAPISVTYKNGKVTVVANERHMTVQIFNTIVGYGICVQELLYPGVLKDLKKILVLDKFKAQGFVFTGGRKDCRNHNKIPMDKRESFFTKRTSKYYNKEIVASKKVVDKNRRDSIKKQFSPWNGSHRALTNFIQQNMKDPDSYEHIQTTFADKGDYLLVTTKYRGKNSFGGKVIQMTIAKISIDGRILKIIK